MNADPLMSQLRQRFTQYLVLQPYVRAQAEYGLRIWPSFTLQACIKLLPRESKPRRTDAVRKDLDFGSRDIER